MCRKKEKRKKNQTKPNNGIPRVLPFSQYFHVSEEKILLIESPKIANEFLHFEIIYETAIECVQQSPKQ